MFRDSILAPIQYPGESASSANVSTGTTSATGKFTLANSPKYRRAAHHKPVQRIIRPRSVAMVSGVALGHPSYNFAR
jgi:hypothetical protein